MRNILLRLIHTITISMVLVGSLLLCTSSAWARNKNRNDGILKKDEGKSYVAPYSIVLAGIAVGIIVVVKPSFRQAQAKKQLLEEEQSK